MTKEILIKFLNNKCTSEELSEVIHWINNEALNTDGVKKGNADWNLYKGDENLLNDYDSNLLLHEIHKKIEKEKLPLEKDKNNLRQTSVFKWLTKAAAILLLPVLGLLVYTNSDKQLHVVNSINPVVDSLEIIAPIGSRTKVQLSDGSKVYLNYGSKIKYPHFFSGDTREVELWGEGYFEVAHNPDCPFIVKTEKLNIKALGTTFNVQYYPGDDFISASLVEGEIVIQEKEINGTTKTIGAMEPGQHIKYNINTTDIFSSKGNIEKYIAWKDGKLVFVNESILNVGEKLSRMYNVDIEIIEESIFDYTYTVTFVDEPLFQILDLMTIATPISYEALPRKKLPNGTFSKQKIIIKKRIL